MTLNEMRVRLLVKQELADREREELSAFAQSTNDDTLLNFIASAEAAALNLSQAYRCAGFCVDGMLDREQCAAVADEEKEWMLDTLASGRKTLRLDDPYWRDHFMSDYIEEDLRNGKDVSIYVLLVSNRPPSPSEIERGQELARKLNLENKEQS